MAVDRYGNPIFATEPLTAFAGLTLPTAATTHPLQNVIDSLSMPTGGGAPPPQSLLDSISAPKLASVPTSNTLALLLGALGNRASLGNRSGAAAAAGAGVGSKRVTTSTGWGSKNPIKWLENFAKPFGLTVTSTTSGNHVKTSWHYSGHAIDIAGSADRMMSAAKAALKHPQDFKEMFYDPLGKYIKNGKVVKGAIGGHSDHVHIAH